MINTLQYIAQHYGDQILSDGTKLLAYYADLAPREKTQWQMLEYLVKCDGHSKLLAASKKNRQEQIWCVNLLVQQMTTRLLISETAATTVCHNFLLAVGGADLSEPASPEPEVEIIFYDDDSQPETKKEPVFSRLKQFLQAKLQRLPKLRPLLSKLWQFVQNKPAWFWRRTALIGAGVVVLCLLLGSILDSIFPQVRLPLETGDELAVVNYMDILLHSDARGYSVHDITGDGIKELILYSDSGKWSFYSYQDGTIHSMGAVYSSGSYLCKSGKRLIFVQTELGQTKGQTITCTGLSVQTEGTPKAGRYTNRLPVMNISEKYPFGRSLRLLNSVLPRKLGLFKPNQASFTQDGNTFTNGRITVAPMENNWIVSINAVTGKLKGIFHIDSKDENTIYPDAAVVGVTKKRIYVQTIDSLTSEGLPVYAVAAYSHAGLKMHTMKNLNHSWFEGGYLIVQNNRGYPYPCYTCVIDPKDRVVLEKDNIWDVSVYNGRVYYLCPPGNSLAPETQVEIHSVLGIFKPYRGTILTGSSQNIYMDENIIWVGTLAYDLNGHLKN